MIASTTGQEWAVVCYFVVARNQTGAMAALDEFARGTVSSLNNLSLPLDVMRSEGLQIEGVE
jgi:hypothetical protein